MRLEQLWRWWWWWTTYNSNHKWNNETCQCDSKSCHKCKKDYNWNPNIGICKNKKYLKGIAQDSVIASDGIIFAMYIVSTKMTNTTATDVTKKFSQ